MGRIGVSGFRRICVRGSRTRLMGPIAEADGSSIQISFIVRCGQCTPIRGFRPSDSL
jgi:hypothetical protein